MWHRCGHCKKLVPVYEKVGKAFADNDSVVITKFDATANDIPDTKKFQARMASPLAKHWACPKLHCMHGISVSFCSAMTYTCWQLMKVADGQPDANCGMVTSPHAGGKVIA